MGKRRAQKRMERGQGNQGIFVGEINKWERGVWHVKWTYCGNVCGGEGTDQGYRQEIRERREGVTERQGRIRLGKQGVWEYGRGQGSGVVESDGSVIAENDDSKVEVEVEGDREREPEPGTSGLGVQEEIERQQSGRSEGMDNQECWDDMGDDDSVLVDMVRDIGGALDENAQEDRDQEREGYNGHGQELVNGGGNGNGTEGANRDMGLKRSAQGLNEGKEVTGGGEKGLGWKVHIASSQVQVRGDVSDDEMSEDGEGSGVESEQELDGEGDHGYGRREGVRAKERKGGVWIVVGDSILPAKDMRDGLQATVQADEVKVWGESGARMRDMVRLVEVQMGTVRKEGKKVEGIVLHVGTNDFGRGMNAAGMVMRAEQMAIVGGVRLYWSVMLPRTKEAGLRSIPIMQFQFRHFEILQFQFQFQNFQFQFMSPSETSIWRQYMYIIFWSLLYEWHNMKRKHKQYDKWNTKRILIRLYRWYRYSFVCLYIYNVISSTYLTSLVILQFLWWLFWVMI